MNELIQLLEILVLVLFVVPILQIVADDRFRTIFPQVHAALAIVLLGWLLLILGLTIFLPQALLPLALVSTVLLLVSAWRFHAAYGRSQGLPPGSLSPIAAIRGTADRNFFLKQAERHGPFFKFSQISSNVICVVGLDRAQRLLRTHEDALIPSAIPFSKQISGGFLRYMDDETYRVYGNLFRKAFSKSVVDTALPVTRQVTQCELKNMEEACQSVPSHAVNPEPYLKRIVYARSCEIYSAFCPVPRSTDVCNCCLHSLKNVIWRVRLMLGRSRYLTVCGKSCLHNGRICSARAMGRQRCVR